MRALKNDPDAFGSTYEQEETKPLGHIIERIQHTKDQFALGCFDDNNTLVGIVNFSRENRLRRHIKGLGKALIIALIERATKECEGLEQIHLTVVSNNKSAKLLYVSLGYEVYGVEPHALKFDEQYFDEDLMILRLRL